MRSINKIEILNIFWIISAFILAAVAPISTFVLAYAILGPLHYTTQLTWLKSKEFYTDKSSKFVIVLGSVLVSSLYLIVTVFKLKIGWFSYHNAIAFIFSLSLIILIASVLKLPKNVLIFGVIFLVATTLFLWNNLTYIIIMAILVGSIIHVYCFTLFHTAYGFTKTKSKLSLLSIIFMLLVPFLIYWLPVEKFPNYDFLTHNDFLARLSGDLIYIIKGAGANTETLSFYQAYYKIEIFAAFAYLFHYLNWFTKTKIIKWHDALNKRNTIVIISISVICSLTFLVKFEYGLYLTIFLSYLHVFAEFPLNILSVKSIGHYLHDSITKQT